MTPPRDETNGRPTRQRLLEVAGEIFADQGYERTVGRDICDRAHTNLAAINYHFGSKEQLYAEVLKEAHRRLVTVEQLEQAIAEVRTPRDRLGVFVRVLLTGLLAPSPSDWHMRVILREVAAPTTALNELVEQEMRPKFEIFRRIVAELVNLPPRHEAVGRGCMSVVAQCLFAHQGRPVIQRLAPTLVESDDWLERYIRHVTRFSLAGLRQIGAQARRESHHARGLRTRK